MAGDGGAGHGSSKRSTGVHGVRAGFKSCLWNLMVVCLWAGHIHTEPKLPLPQKRNRRLPSCMATGRGPGPVQSSCDSIFPTNWGQVSC